MRKGNLSREEAIKQVGLEKVLEVEGLDCDFTNRLMPAGFEDDVEFAAMTSDRCAMFFDGQLVSVGTPNSFFSTNTFYTTAASRISRHRYDNAVSWEDVVRLCLENGELEPC